MSPTAKTLARRHHFHQLGHPEHSREGVIYWGTAEVGDGRQPAILVDGTDGARIYFRRTE